MNTRNYGLYAVAIVIVGTLWLGVPGSTLFLLGLVLICPIMMIVMMRGMHSAGHDMGAKPPHNEDRSGRHDDLAQH